MESVINKYMAYEPYANDVGHMGYNIGQDVAKKAIEDGKNPYETEFDD